MSGLVHDAFVFSDDGEYVASMAPFVREGVDRGETVVAVTLPSNLALLHDELGTDVTERVRAIDARNWYEHPPATVAGYSRLFRDALRSGAPGLRVIGEVQFGMSDAQHDAWLCYESALNRVFADLPAWVVCPYDTRLLPGDVVDGASATHPFVADGNGRFASDRYADPETFVSARQSIDGLPARRPDIDIGLDAGVAEIRRRVTALTRASTADEVLADQFVVAANEIATNAILHGGGRGRVRMWADGNELVCVVSDAGPGLDDVLAGFEPPASERVGGRGLWIARQLCDAVHLGRAPEGGLAVALHAAAR